MYNSSVLCDFTPSLSLQIQAVSAFMAYEAQQIHK